MSKFSGIFKKDLSKMKEKKRLRRRCNKCGQRVTLYVFTKKIPVYKKWSKRKKKYRSKKNREVLKLSVATKNSRIIGYKEKKFCKCPKCFAEDLFYDM